MKREIKKKLKEDEFVSIFGRIMNSFESWRQEALIGLAVLAGLAVLLGGLFILRGAQMRSSSADLGRILELRSGLDKTPGNAAELEALAKKGKYAHVAATQLASHWVESGDLDKAAAVLAGLKDSPKDYAMDAVLFHKAEALEKKGDKAGALALFRRIQTEYAQSYFGYDAGLRAGKLDASR